MSAPRLVLLHGFAGTPEVWQPVLEHLPEELRRDAWAPALAGHGIAAPISGPDSFEAEVERLAAGLDELVGPDRPNRELPHLVGYSLGGRLALGLLARHRERFSGATLIGANPGLDPPGLGTPEERVARRAADERWARQLEEEGLQAFLDAWEAQPLFASQTPEQRREQRRLRSDLEPRALAAAHRALSLAGMPDYRPDLAKLDLPVTLVAGEADPKFHRLALEMAKALPRTEVHLVPRVGHNVVLEAPRAVAEIITGAVLTALAP